LDIIKDSSWVQISPGRLIARIKTTTRIRINNLSTIEPFPWVLAITPPAKLIHYFWELMKLLEV
jgi:hypothetical protein